MNLVIIGNGVAGTMVARLVAGGDSSIEIAIYTDESHAYYPRPRLIDFVADEVSAEQMPQYDMAWYASRGIALHLDAPVASIHPSEQTIVLASGAVVPYDRLVLANGAHCWMPPIPGSEQSHVHTLRSLEDALAIRERLVEARHVTLLGGGLLGLDTAAAVCEHVPEVTVVEMAPRLLPRQLDREGADMLASLIGDRGIQVITGELCERIDGSSVTLKSGRELVTDMVIVSAGVRANCDLARDAGLECDRGVVVDERLQTSDGKIMALGDVAQFGGRVWGIIPAALAQARVAASRLTGGDATYTDIVPSTTLKVSGINLTSIGEVCPDDDACHEYRYADRAQGVYKKVVVRDGRVVGAILLGDRKDVVAVNRLMSQDIDVWEHRALLEQAGMDLHALLKAAMD